MWEGTIGEIRLFAGNFAPQYWALCDGGLMSIAQFTALFSIVGTQYGGDGRVTFARPLIADLPSGVKYILCVQGIYPSRP